MRDSEGITVFSVRGEATSAGFVTVFRGFLFDPTPRVLWDLRECSLSHIPLEQLRAMVSQLMRSGFDKRPHGRSALVCSGDEDHNVVRILIAYAEANDYPIELAVFRDIEQAKGWLATE